jgi:hypothetical protein
MPHQCIRCGGVYPDGSDVLLKGCPVCGSRFFFFFKNESLQKVQNMKLTNDERKEIESDIKQIIGPEEERPVILDLESINVSKPGKFEIDLVALFKRKPLVYKLEEGKYIIDLASSFQLLKKEEK